MANPKELFWEKYFENKIIRFMPLEGVLWSGKKKKHRWSVRAQFGEAVGGGGGGIKLSPWKRLELGEWREME